MHLKHATLTFLVDQQEEPTVLLGMKKRGFGEGKWNGYGGKILYNETEIEAAVRETKEENGLELQPTDLQKMGELTFLMPHHPMGTQLVHVYTVKKWRGEPQESDEMIPHWFSVKELPFEKMWPDDKHWLQHVLEGKPVTATFLFGPDNQTLKAMEIHYPKTIEELQKPSVYFSVSISGGREHAHYYKPLVEAIRKYGRVLTEHFADENLLTEREEGKTDEFLYWRDHAYIEACDWFVADVSQPSFGVGYEIALAEQLHKKIICLHYKNSPKSVSPMISGNYRTTVIEYENEKDATQKLESVLKKWELENQHQKN
ncbi:NUDIX domain-containing protein [Candidatus Micrarchaeota archaeon]|nr:NUDIX domain-containing protein [Candidatus Micrarchaeota archaeon]MBU1929917.1 NUDIX domain-containing protein [Candidatus Micrarchaeota archaeon]